MGYDILKDASLNTKKRVGCFFRMNITGWRLLIEQDQRNPLIYWHLFS